MNLIPPFWFNQRQGKAEPAANDLYRLTAPNLPEVFLRVFQGQDGRWAGALRLKADGSDIGTSSPDFDTPEDALGAAFELYRNYLVVGTQPQALRQE